MLMKSRSLRRHHAERIKQRIRKQRIHCYSWLSNLDDPRQVGRLAHTRKPCSCWMCGNPRRYFNEPTWREKRFDKVI